MEKGFINNPHDLGDDSEGLEPEVLQAMDRAIAEARENALKSGPILVSGASEDGGYYLWELHATGEKRRIRKIDPPVQYPVGTVFNIQ
jgi:hypothetical protein